jgi:hypothetical protein
MVAWSLQPIRQMRGQVPIPRAHALVPPIWVQWKEAHKHHYRLQGLKGMSTVAYFPLKFQ